MTNKKWDEFCASRDNSGEIIRRDEDAYVATFNDLDNKTEVEQRTVANAAAPDVEVEMPLPATPPLAASPSKTAKATGTAVAAK